jgi:hypothetical protein
MRTGRPRSVPARRTLAQVAELRERTTDGLKSLDKPYHIVQQGQRFALQQNSAPNGRDGSKGDVTVGNRDVFFTPMSGH